MEYKDKYVDVKIYGFCNGVFGRDSYEDKVIIANGEDWIVVRNESGQTEFANFDSSDEMDELIEKWRNEEDC